MAQQSKKIRGRGFLNAIGWNRSDKIDDQNASKDNRPQCMKSNRRDCAMNDERTLRYGFGKKHRTITSTITKSTVSKGKGKGKNETGRDGREEHKQSRESSAHPDESRDFFLRVIDALGEKDENPPDENDLNDNVFTLDHATTFQFQRV